MLKLLNIRHSVIYDISFESSLANYQPILHSFSLEFAQIISLELADEILDVVVGLMRIISCHQIVMKIKLFQVLELWVFTNERIFILYLGTCEFYFVFFNRDFFCGVRSRLLFNICRFFNTLRTDLFLLLLSSIILFVSILE